MLAALGLALIFMPETPPLWEVVLGLALVISGSWSGFCEVARTIRGLFVVTVVTDGDTMQLISSYLLSESINLGRSRAHFSENLFSVKVGRTITVPFEAVYRESIRVLYRGRPIWTSMDTSEQSNFTSYCYRLSFIRGTVNSDRLLADAYAWSVEASSHKRFEVITHHGESNNSSDEVAERNRENITSARRGVGGIRVVGADASDLISGLVSGDAIANLAISPELNRVVETARHWFRSRGWYQVRGIPWRIGAMLHGPKGTGKTSIVRAIAMELDIPLHVVDLGSMSNQDLHKTWREIKRDTPCIALFDDVDAIFDKDRENKTPSSQLTFNSLLQCLDGAERAEGVAVFGLTNHIDLIDTALLRFGRFDQTIEVGIQKTDCYLKIARRILLDDEWAARFVRSKLRGKRMSPAEFTQACFQEALSGGSVEDEVYR